MEAASNLTATCSIALGRDVAAAALRLSPLPLRRILQAWERLAAGGSGRGPSGGVSAKRTAKRKENLDSGVTR